MHGVEKNHIFEKSSGFSTIVLVFGKSSSFFEKQFMDLKKVHRFKKGSSLKKLQKTEKYSWILKNVH